ncbi:MULTISPECIES: efflux RND transporter periplasmic adaptor subunit [Desulfococcus]|uniref:efflux RND transporter periplasmic adaptor subunit n=1 Tax=Desulfococcus TaxID=896 RepID=UPI00058D4F1A|nr:efflux RND transporter periplasmic adaptor subunit [Desulfococcus multivorans]
MKPIGAGRLAVLTVVAAVVAALGWMIYNKLQGGGDPEKQSGGPQPAPVAVAPIQRGPIVLSRTFSGALEAPAKFVVAPKVSGRIEAVFVDLADTVSRGRVVAALDDDEYVQAVAEARAELAVNRANLAEAESALEIAGRELARIETLRKRGVTSDAQMDTARANQLAKKAQLEVARAHVTKAEAALAAANIRLGYTRVTAGWTGSDALRVVAERYVEEGDTVSANTPLMAIVDLDPLIGVIFVTEKDYARLELSQSVTLTTDAYPGERFEGRVDRIAPIFQEATRQAKVELTIENPRHRLKPGMFIRATVVLDRAEDAVIVPEEALTSRGDRTGVFVVDAAGRSVSWRSVTVGIREAGRVQVAGEDLDGRVVILGQQLLEDGSPVTIPDDAGKSGGGIG